MSIAQRLDDLDTALVALVAACDDEDLTALPSGELMEVARRVEGMRNRLPVLDHAFIRAAEARSLAQTLAARNTRTLLAMALRITPAEATRRVRAAAALNPRRTLLGEALPPPRPVLAAAQRDGGVSAEQAEVILRTLTALQHSGQVDPSDVDRAEVTLVGYCDVFAPLDLGRIAARVSDALHPDGTLAEATAQRDRCGLTLTSTGQGTYLIGGELTGEVGAQLTTVLSPLAAPHPADESGEPDDRSPALRLHDALGAAMGLILQAGGLPDSGGTPATVIVTIPYQNLLALTGYGVTSDGTLLPAREVLHLAAQAEIIPTVLDHHGAVLDQGRTRRIATRPQTLALIARDGGCTFPGCDYPPDWCQRHHVLDWLYDGLTEVDNLTLLCGYHHRVHQERGWTCRMNQNRLPEWVPPAWIDPTQTPRRNTTPSRVSTFSEPVRA